MHAALAAYADHHGRNWIGAAALLLAGLLAQTTIVAGMVAHGPPQWPQYVAKEFGWFKQDKIDRQLVTVGGGLAAIGTVTAPYPRKSAIFDGSFAQAAN
jgi:ABC-type nitrate/sulfonate/bicarbonate transport system substrate-binding protein